MNDSIGVRERQLTGVERRMFGIFATISAVASVASGWSEQIRTSLSIGWSRSPSSLAGTWWKAAATRSFGSRRLHAGGDGSPGRHQRLELLADAREGVGHRDDDLAAEVSARPDCAVCVAAVPRRGDDHQVGVGGARVVAGVDHQARGPATASMSPSTISTARREREPITVSKPTEARRAARPLPAGPVPPRIPMRIGDTTSGGCEASGLLAAPRAGGKHGSGVSPWPSSTASGILVTGVLTDASLGRRGPRPAPRGPRSSSPAPGGGLSLTKRTARKLAGGRRCWSSDVTTPPRWTQVRRALGDLGWDRRRRCSTPSASRRRSCLGSGGFTGRGGTTWREWPAGLGVLAEALTEAVVPIMVEGGSVVGLDFDATARRGRPTTGWGWPRPPLESTSRYLARDLGPKGMRVNLVAAGPSRRWRPSRSPGFSRFEDVWDERSPLGWDVSDAESVARSCVALLSDWFPATPGRSCTSTAGSTPSAAWTARSRFEHPGLATRLVPHGARTACPHHVDRRARRARIAAASSASSSHPSDAGARRGRPPGRDRGSCRSQHAPARWPPPGRGTATRPSVRPRTSPSIHSRTASTSSAAVGRS